MGGREWEGGTEGQRGRGETGWEGEEGGIREDRRKARFTDEGGSAGCPGDCTRRAHRRFPSNPPNSPLESAGIFWNVPRFRRKSTRIRRNSTRIPCNFSRIRRNFPSDPPEFLPSNLPEFPSNSPEFSPSNSQAFPLEFARLFLRIRRSLFSDSPKFPPSNLPELSSNSPDLPLKFAGVFPRIRRGFFSDSPALSLAVYQHLFPPGEKPAHSDRSESLGPGRGHGRRRLRAQSSTPRGGEGSEDTGGREAGGWVGGTGTTGRSQRRRRMRV